MTREGGSGTFSPRFMPLGRFGPIERQTTVGDASDVTRTTAAERYAIIDDGGKQYTVREGGLVRIDLRDAEVGSEIIFEKVLLVGSNVGSNVGSDVGSDEGSVKLTKVGKPTVEGARVLASVEAEEKGKKVHGLRRRHHSRAKKRWGHRQRYTLVRVGRIVSPEH